MQVVVINSQKGGSGKTMLAKHLSPWRRNAPAMAPCF